jgi:hypothetical protein
MDQRLLLAPSIVTSTPMLGQHADGERTAAAVRERWSPPHDVFRLRVVTDRMPHLRMIHPYRWVKYLSRVIRFGLIK